MAEKLQSTLIKSSLGVDKIKKSVMSFSSSINSTQKTAMKINTSLVDSNRQKQQATRLSISNFQKRREAVRRREREDIIEASGIGGAVKRQGKVIAASTKGFLGRILDFVGTLMVGWLLNNLPVIIRLSEELIGRMRKLYVVLRSFMNNVTTILSGFNSLLVGTIQNFMTFDFSDQKQLIDSSLSTIQGGLLGIERDLSSAMDLLTQPLDLGFGVLDIPDRDQGPIAAPEGVPSGGAGLPDAQSPEMYRIAAALATEASGQQSIVDVMQVVVNRKASGKYGNTYTEILSAGTGGTNVAFEGVWKRPGGPKTFRQIQTLDDASKWSGQSKQSLLKIISDIQNPTLQQSAAKHVKGALEFRGSPQNYGGKRLPNSAWRGGSNDNQFLLDPSQDPIRKEGAASFNLPAPVKPSPATPLPRSRVIDEIDVSGPKGGLPDVGLSGGGGEYGAPRKGRKHAGIDIGTSGQKGWLVGFKSSGTVTYAGAAGGYGLLVIIRSGNTEYYFAHLARIFVKKGPYNGEAIGEIGNTGIGSGIHLHYEVRVSGQPINPRPYLNLLDIGRKTVPLSTPISAANVPATTSSPVSAQIASAKPGEASQNASQLAKERRGQTIIVPIPDQTQIAQTTPTIGGSSRRGNPMQSAGFDKNALNSMSHMQLTSLA